MPNTRISTMPMLRLGIAVVTLAVLASGCGWDRATRPVELSPANTVGNVTVSPMVAIMAVGQELQLQVAVTSLTGGALPVIDSILYLLNIPADSTRVGVSKEGVLTALAPTTIAVPVNVFVFAGGGVRGEQALVQVTPAAIAGPLEMSVQRIPPDSAKLGKASTKTMAPPVIRSPDTGERVTNPIMRYFVRLPDESRVLTYKPEFTLPGVPPSATRVQWARANFVNPDQIRPTAGEGTVWVHGAANVYGTFVHDSVLFTLTEYVFMTISVTRDNLVVWSGSNGLTRTLAPGGRVTFSQGISTSSANPITVAFTFDNPAEAMAAAPPSTTGGASGNVAPLAMGQSSIRRFMHPGTYAWTATVVSGPEPWLGQTQSGKILVQ